MNVLYKYCDREGIEKILRTLELKLPYISDVNDPYECSPFFYCPEDKSAMKESWLRSFKRKHISPPVNCEQVLNEEFKKGDIQKKLEKEIRKDSRDFNRKNCLLSFSKIAHNAVMWAHYTEQHKGAVIGIDFDNVFPDTNKKLGILMDAVSYSEHRPKISIWSEDRLEELRKAFLTKSIDWKYEKELRTLLAVSVLENWQQQGLALLKDFKGKKTWFLRLNPASIRKVVFGLVTSDDLKAKILKLKERKDLQHIELLRVEESETYAFNLKDIA